MDVKGKGEQKWIVLFWVHLIRLDSLLASRKGLETMRFLAEEGKLAEKSDCKSDCGLGVIFSRGNGVVDDVEGCW